MSPLHDIICWFLLYNVGGENVLTVLSPKCLWGVVGSCEKVTNRLEVMTKPERSLKWSLGCGGGQNKQSLRVSQLPLTGNRRALGMWIVSEIYTGCSLALRRQQLFLTVLREGSGILLHSAEGFHDLLFSAWLMTCKLVTIIKCFGSTMLKLYFWFLTR